MNILVTGGAGYIGSHACKALASAGHTPITFDNLSRGNRWAVKWGPFEQGDIADAQRIGLMGSSMGGIETLLMMTRRHSDAILGQDVHLKAAVALYPICWLYNRVPGADFVDLVDAPVRILVDSEDDYDGGGSACEAQLRDLAPSDAGHMSLRVFSGATHIFDSFAGTFEYNDPTANRRQGGIIHVRPDPQARQQARDDLTRFLATALRQ